MATPVNWHPGNIFDGKNRRLEGNSGQAGILKQHADGWAWIGWEGLDVWTACRLLNDYAARIVEQEG